MLDKFQSYQKSVVLYKICKNVALPGYLKNQLLRAASSITLNLAEGSGKSSFKDRRRFYEIAFGSLREVQAIIALEPAATRSVANLAFDLGGMLYRLIKH